MGSGNIMLPGISKNQSAKSNPLSLSRLRPSQFKSESEEFSKPIITQRGWCDTEGIHFGSILNDVALIYPPCGC